MADAIRLNALLPERLDSMAGQVRERLCQDQQVSGMKLAWEFVAAKLGEALDQALDCKLADVLAECWAEAEPIRKLAAAACRAPGEPCTVQLGAHQLSRELKPVIAVTIGTCPCVELNFLFELSAHFSGARLTIVDGHIVRGDLGDAWASAQLSFEGVPLTRDSETPKLSIGEAMEFAAPGIALPGLARANHSIAS